MVVKLKTTWGLNKGGCESAEPTAYHHASSTSVLKWHVNPNKGISQQY